MIIFLNNYPNAEELKDGYYNRIVFIDNLFTDYLRFYINESSSVDSLSLKPVALNAYQINVPINSFACHEFVCQIFSSVQVVTYLHSIYGINSSFKQSLYKKAKYKIWDVHGVVPEELIMLNQQPISVVNEYNNYEHLAMQESDYIICVTKKMQEHLLNKYFKIQQNKKFIQLPIFSIASSQDTFVKTERKIPVVIYSGGVQKWQSVNKMLDWVYNNHTKARILFLVSDVEFIKFSYRNLYLQEFPGELLSLLPKDLDSYYKDADYGLILREDCLVNNVAFPTKLIDYISNGIIPIVDTKNIGDFNELGLQVINYHDEINGFLDSQINEMRELNDKILQQIYNIADSAIVDLQQIMANSYVNNDNFMIVLMDKLCNIHNKFSDVVKQLDRVQNELSDVVKQLDRVQNELSSIYNSKSWRITKPFRWLKSFLSN